MKIRIYQINSDRDEHRMMFMSHDRLERFQGSPEVDSKIYDKVYDKEVDCSNLEEVYTLLNINRPSDYRGRSLSVSDVVEVYESDAVPPGFYFCDSVGFKQVAFHPEECSVSERMNEQSAEKISVLLVEPGKYPRMIEIEDSLEAMQRVVGGDIEEFMPYTVEIFVDLAAFRLVYQVDGETVHEIACGSLSELNGYLANLDFDEMVAHADNRYQQEHADRGELAEHEPEPKEPAEKEQSAVLAPPKPKRERVVFTTLHPEIPADQRRNFRITDSELGHGTRSEKYAANVAAIRCLKEIEAEGRLATRSEQEILSRYVGWGGLADCFDERHGKYLELKSLLSEDEYAAARASSLTAF